MASCVMPDSVLEDLCSRFLINIPEEERKDVVRLCFQIETAHWFYIDFHRQEQPELPSLGIKEFTNIIFQQFPFLNKTGENVNQIFEDWKKYKYSVPVYGAIILNEALDKCLLVQPFMSRTSWGFPKGKVNKDETEFDCAVREVFEETGFDIRPHSRPSEYLQVTIHDHQVRLYLVAGVPELTHFQPKTRGEIKNIQWFSVDYLPSHKKDTVSKENLGLNPNAFFMVMPFVKDLRKWIQSKLETGAEDAAKVQLQKLLEKEELRLEEEQKRTSLERRRMEHQKRFLLQHELNHPLRHHHLNVHLTGSEGRRGIEEKDEQQNAHVVKIMQRSKEPRTCEETAASPLQRLMSGNLPALHTFSYNHNLQTPGTSSAVQTCVNPSRTRAAELLMDSQARVSYEQASVAQKLDSWEDTEFLFSAPAFINFKFNRKTILACLPK